MPTTSRRQAFAERAGRVMGLAAETFNDGLRAYYLAFAATGLVLLALGHAGRHGGGGRGVLYRREFHSELLGVLASAGDPGPAEPER
jgi:uncharacterized membrane protein